MWIITIQLLKLVHDVKCSLSSERMTVDLSNTIKTTQGWLKDVGVIRGHSWTLASSLTQMTVSCSVIKC